MAAKRLTLQSSVDSVFLCSLVDVFCFLKLENHLKNKNEVQQEIFFFFFAIRRYKIFDKFEIVPLNQFKKGFIYAGSPNKVCFKTWSLH